jgi:hypothetical protein
MARPLPQATGGGTTRPAPPAPTGTLVRNSAGQLEPDVSSNLIFAAALKYHVPAAILNGVFGMETDFGADVNTSSAGAVGFMQFIPSTAARYGYPLTNKPTYAQAQQQFDASAHYLSDLFKQTGSWDSALQHYSGGGYGLAQVQAKAGQRVGSGSPDAGFLGTGVGSADNPFANVGLPNPLSSVASAITNVFDQLVSDAKYAVVLVAALAAGVYLLVHGATGKANPADQVRTIIQPIAKAKAAAAE